MLNPTQSRYKKRTIRKEGGEQAPAQERRIHAAEARVIGQHRPRLPMINLFRIAHQLHPVIQQDDLNFKPANQPG